MYRPQGVDAGQIHHGAAFFIYDLSHLLVYRDTGKVADMLIGSGEGVEESRFPAVLISNECKDHFGSSSTSIFEPPLRAALARSRARGSR